MYLLKISYYLNSRLVNEANHNKVRIYSVYLKKCSESHQHQPNDLAKKLSDELIMKNPTLFSVFLVFVLTYHVANPRPFFFNVFRNIFRSGSFNKTPF